MIDQKILAVKIKAKGVVEYLRRPQVRQYENNATVIWAWFEEVEAGESITAKMHYELPNGETMIPEQLFTSITTSEDLINDIPNTEHYGEVVIPSGTKVYVYPIPQGMTAIDGELKYNIVAYLVDGEIIVSQQDKIRIWKSTAPTGTFIPDVIDSTLEALLASKTDLVDFNALRNGTLGFTEIDLDGHSIDWDNLAGTVQIELQNGVVLDTGLEVLKFGRASGSISDGTPAQFVKYQGQRPIFKTPVAEEVNDNPHTVRVLATQDFANNQDGYFTRFGNVRNINTMGYLLPGEDANDETTWGDTRLWYDPVTNGLTRTRPSSPNAKISMGYVTRFHSTQGVIDTDVVVYPKFSELQDVQNGATDGQVWVYDSELGLTKPSSRLSDAETHLDNLQIEVDNLELVGGIIINEATDKENDVLVTRSNEIKFDSATIETHASVGKYDYLQDYRMRVANGDDVSESSWISLGFNYGIDISTQSGGFTKSNLLMNNGSGTNGYALLQTQGDDTVSIELESAYNELIITAGSTKVNGNFYIFGNIYQEGSAYETHAEQVYTKDDLIILRDGAVSGIGVGNYAGFIAKKADGTNDASLVFDGHGIARVGDITYVGGVPDFSSTQALATRQDTPIANGVAYWNDTDKRFDTDANFYYLGGNIVNATGYLSSLGIRNLGSTNNAWLELKDTGTVISRNINDANPALKVNLASAGTTGNIAEFQEQGVTKSLISKLGTILGAGVANINSVNNSRLQLNTDGAIISRNINDANPALTVNEQQGTGDILRLQYGGANALIFDRLGKINKTQVNADYLLENGTRLLSTFNYGNNGTVTTEGNNLFLGNAGNSTMGSTATAAYQSSYNIGVGNNVLLNNTTGYRNNAVGFYALASNTTGSYNNAIGVDALRFNTTGSSNSAIGVDALRNNTTGIRNNAVGYAALYANTTGSNNSAIGNNAGRYLSDGTTGNETGSNNTFIGRDTKAGATQGLSNSTALGYQAYFDASNQMVFGNESVTNFKFNRNASSRADFASILVDTGGTLLASGDSSFTFTVNALTNYKYVEVRGMIDGFRWASVKLPVSKFVYVSSPADASTGLIMAVDGYNNVGSTFIAPLRLICIPNNAQLTELKIITEGGAYDVFWEVYGWNY